MLSTTIRHGLAGLALWGCLVASGIADEELPTLDILIRNVHIIDQEPTELNTPISLLIRGGNVHLISRDPISRDEADLVYDAKGGYILGRLRQGKTANFLIIEGDPRVDPRLLLDTKTTASFAVIDGVIERNRFGHVTAPTVEEVKKESGSWLAYAPPPLAVPQHYNDPDRWNRFETKAVSGIFAAAVMLDRQSWQDQDDNSLQQVGELRDFDGGEIRALRFGGVGTINFEKPWVWTVFGATHAFDKGFDATEDDDFSLFDLRLDIPIWKSASFSIGKQKEPISMERLMSMVYLPMQERAAVSDALLPSRNVGIVAASNLLNDRMTIAGGAFNNWLDKDQPSSFSDNSTQYVARFTAVAYQSEDESTLLHLGMAYRHSDGVEGSILATEPEFDQAPLFVSSDPFETDDVETLQAEISLRRGPFWLHSEYIKSNIDSLVWQNPNPSGYHVTASWILTGEMRAYNKRVGVFGRIPVSRDVNNDGWGAWEISARYSYLDGNEGLLDAGELDIWSAGVNWWLTPLLNLNLNYRFVTLERFGIVGESHGLNSRISMLLE